MWAVNHAPWQRREDFAGKARATDDSRAASTRQVFEGESAETVHEDVGVVAVAAEPEPVPGF